MNAIAPTANRAASQSDAKLAVFYDGECPLCAREVRLYRRLDRDGAIDWFDLHESGTALAAAGLDKCAAVSRLHARRSDGSVISGVDVFRAVWSELPGLRWIATVTRSEGARRALEGAYAGFLTVRAPASAARFRRFPAWLQRDLRCNEAGEFGAVWIYRAILALSRDADVLTFAAAHLETERRHLLEMRELVPWYRRSLLRPLWFAAAAGTGAIAALAGRRGVCATVDAVETFVDRHYLAQIERLDGTADLAGVRDRLEQCRADEIAHRDEARAACPCPGPVLRVWQRTVMRGSSIAAACARVL